MRASTYAKIKINEMQPLAQLARALADETRLRILTVLLEGAATVSDLVTRLGVPQPRVSTQLALLRPRKARRVFAYGCLDWTERRPRLGGALGAAILEALAAAGVIRREKSSRAVAFLKPVSRWLAAAANRTVPS